MRPGEVIEVEQGTDEWRQVRCGRITASRIGDLMATTRSGPAASRKNYIAELVAERLTGQPQDGGFVSAAMQWGIDQEQFAIGTYEAKRDAWVTRVGFVTHPDIEMAGCSPDGLVDDDGMVQVKCPNTATHIATIRGGPIDRKYLLQMQWEMACTGRAWSDFVSYDPRLPEDLRLFVQRVLFDPAIAGRIQTAVMVADMEVNDIIADLRRRAGS